VIAPDYQIREAGPEDCAMLLAMTRELADYEGLTHQVVASPERISESLFGPRPAAFCLLAEDAAGVAGFAVWYPSYSTFEGLPGMFIEDVYVRPTHRRRGLGRAFVQALAGICVDRSLTRLEWRLLDWNAPADAFFETLGAVSTRDWRFGRLSAPQIASLAQEGS
jgi:diamine N-acetyltransferase